MIFPKNKSGKLELIIKYGGLAPSSHNTQPWNFKVEKDAINIYADFSRNLPVGDPKNRELYISLGAAIQNIIICSNALGIKTDFSLFPSKQNLSLVGIVKLKFSNYVLTKNDERTLSAIVSRRTNRTPYNPKKKIPQIIANQIYNKVSELGCNLTLITNRTVINEIADLVKSGLIRFMSKKEFRKELSGWIRHDWSKRGDGLPGYSIGMPGIISILAPVLIQSKGPIKEVAESEKLVVESCSTLGVITIPKDDVNWWVKTGLAFEGVAIALEKKGISTAILTSIIESPKEKARLKKIVKGEPALFFRLGYATGKGIAVPRRVNVTL